MSLLQNPHQIRPLISYPIQNFPSSFQPSSPTLHFSTKTPPKPIHFHPLTPKSQPAHHPAPQTRTQDDGIPAEDVKILAKFKSRYNYIRVLEVSRRADHPFAGSRLLLLDNPGNIHSISFIFKSLTSTYFDVFATLPPILPPGPVGILGFGAGSAARSILELYPEVAVHGWELDPSVIAVGREYFGLSKLERQYPGSLVPELQDPNTWKMLRKCLRKGGRIMVNVGGSCVEAEDSTRDGKVVMEDTLKAMHQVFGDKLFVLGLGNRQEDSSLALTGDLPDLEAWKKMLHRSLARYIDKWKPFSG
ncbi:PREDICTED: uncharacterized protein LOC103337926 isoform X2 [Prunus mume]|uniref:Uncharacterized protein LOC103337926 isoform X2 n=1 Tax=Prunus mume TaxID=102107 RepID=A0ABM0PGJ4_PRUMU|nr:PREDICTED: uncharacterized protein LOC103337926 isoform X2 [Prunus mume]